MQNQLRLRLLVKRDYIEEAKEFLRNVLDAMNVEAEIKY